MNNGITHKKHFLPKIYSRCIRKIRNPRTLKAPLCKGNLRVFAQCGANILTINQSIPVSGCATITISAETAGMSESMETLMNRLVAADGVIRAEILAG